MSLLPPVTHMQVQNSKSAPDLGALIHSLSLIPTCTQHMVLCQRLLAIDSLTYRIVEPGVVRMRFLCVRWEYCGQIPGR